jgi:hypothetical protein
MNMKLKKGLFPLILVMVLIGSTLMASAASAAVWQDDLSLRVDRAMKDTGDLLLKQVPEPVIGSVGGEWTIIGLCASGTPIPGPYRDGYLERVEEQMALNQGELSRNKYTEYSRLILALTLLGEDVRDVAGYNLLSKLTDLSLLKKQGINGPVYALLALDSHGYPVENTAGAVEPVTRQSLIDWILAQEITNDSGIKGGFSLGGGSHPDADITGMVLQALAPYRKDPTVKSAIDRSLLALDRMERPDGSFESWGTETSESIVQVIVAKSALGLDASRHVEALMKYYKPGKGFEHVAGDGGNLLATEQGLYALAAYKLGITGGRSLYDMNHIPLAGQGIRVQLDGKVLTFDQPPVNINGRVLVPFRAIFEAFGAEVTWEGTLREVTGILGDREVWLRIGDVNARVQGNPVVLDVPARIENGRTLVPVRFISEGLDAQVEWKQKEQLVVITTR